MSSVSGTQIKNMFHKKCFGRGFLQCDQNNIVCYRPHYLFDKRNQVNKLLDNLFLLIAADLVPSINYNAVKVCYILHTPAKLITYLGITLQISITN